MITKEDVLPEMTAVRVNVTLSSANALYAWLQLSRSAPLFIELMSFMLPGNRISLSKTNTWQARMCLKYSILRKSVN